MEKTLVLKEGSISYLQIQSARAKRIRIVIQPGGIVKVVLPKKINESLAQKFLTEKSSWVFGKIKESLVRGEPKKIYTKEHYHMHKDKTKVVVEEKLKHYAELYGFSYGKVTIKNHKTLWGSCSKRGNLNFNYKLGLLPENLLEYVVVHELCHLKEFNHGKNFWNLVSKTIPEHKKLRQELKKVSMIL